MVSHEVASKIKSPEKRFAKAEIPKSTEIYRGDINDAVIAVQQITGFDITPEWWLNEVGNEGPTEDILKRFDTAFEKFVRTEMGIDAGEEGDDIHEQATPVEIVAEAEAELAEFDGRSKDDPGLEPLRVDFLNALKKHLDGKYFTLGETDQNDNVIFSTSKTYSSEIRIHRDAAEVKILDGSFLETERFMEVNGLPVCELFGASAEIDSLGNVTQTVPTPEKINDIHRDLFGDEPHYLTVTQVESDSPEIDAKTYWQYLSQGVIPVAGTEETNYYIHDRAVDDHVLGWLVSSDRLNEFTSKAGEAISTDEVSVDEAKEAIAAYDFLTSTITLYAWRAVNGPEAPLPLRGNPGDSAEAQRQEATHRLSYAPAAIEQMINKIETVSGVELGVDISELLAEIIRRAEQIHSRAGVRT